MNFKILGAVLWLAVGVALVGLVVSRRPPESVPVSETLTAEPADYTAAETVTVDAAPTVTIPSSMKLGEFELTNTRGEKVTKADVVGQPTVFAFIFTGCTSTCPPITLEMKRLHDNFKDTDLRLFCVTVDPDRDTVEHFGSWADSYERDHERWQFLTGTKQQIHDMIVGGFQLTMQEMFGADRRPGFEVTHTNRVVLVNDEGYPVGSYLILNDGDRARLYRILEGKTAFPAAPKPNRSVAIKRGDGETQSLSADN